MAPTTLTLLSCTLIAAAASIAAAVDRLRAGGGALVASHAFRGVAVGTLCLGTLAGMARVTWYYGWNPLTYFELLLGHRAIFVELSSTSAEPPRTLALFVVNLLLGGALLLAVRKRQGG